MCGIFFSISNNAGDAEDVLSSIRPINERRGPDQHEIIKMHVGNFHFIFSSWVLHMRGVELISQPAVSANGNILLFNGEIFGGLKMGKDENDVLVLLQQLDACASYRAVANVIESIEGPWAFVYFQKSLKKLWFGRDYFGRRSLLLMSSPDRLVISSASKRPEDSSLFWTEVSAGLYYIDLNNIDSVLNNVISIPWLSITNGEPKQPYSDSNIILKSESFSIRSSISTQYLNKISSVQTISSSVTPTNKQASLLEQLLHGCEENCFWPICEKLLTKLRNSVEQRTKVLDAWEPGCKVGILFSGGVDCTVLALLAHEFVSEDDPIDLLNVAFEQKQPTLHRNSKNMQETNVFLVPDRVTGISSYEELCNLFPHRKWNFVEIDVYVKELQAQRIHHIADLTYPKETVLDDSIACALWFASRGKGIIKDAGGTNQPYESPARILLCGMGADEQLGGYSRHRSLYEKTSDYKAVNKEIEMEIERIALRNLGRDDRIVSDHAREARFPYLDEQVVGFLSSLSTEQKADYRYNRGVGEKMLLRGAAYLLGLRNAAVLPKRAIQFGSRIAKSESRHEKGNDKCRRLLQDTVT